MAKYNRVDDNFTGIITNLNGRQYAIAEKLSAQDLLLINIKNGEAVLAHGVKTFEKVEDDGTSQIGVEWTSGDYASSISSFDLKALRREYGKEDVYEMDSFKLEVSYDKEKGSLFILSESEKGTNEVELEVQGNYFDIGNAIKTRLLEFEQPKYEYTVELGLLNAVDEKKRYDYILFASEKAKDDFLFGKDSVDWRGKVVKFDEKEQILLEVMEHKATTLSENTSIIYHNDSPQAENFRNGISVDAVGKEEKENVDYIVTIERSKNQKIGGFDTSKDTVRFSSFESLSDFLKGQPSLNWLDDSVSPLKEYETPVKVITVPATENLKKDYDLYDVLFDMKNGINKLVDPKTGDKLLQPAKESPAKDASPKKASHAKEEKQAPKKNNGMEH